MATITINGISVDPETPHASVAASALASPDTSDTNYILVQTNEPLSDEQKEQLKAAGAEITEYVPDSTYVCYYPPADLGAVRALPFVTLAIRYMQGFKIAPTLRAASSEVHASNLAAQPIERPKSRDAVDIDVVLHGNVSAEAVKEKIAVAAGLDPEEIRAYGKKFRVRIPRRRLEKVAAIDEVRHLEQYVRPSLMNTVAIGILRADRLHDANPVALRGAGQVVAVCDTGFDKGSTSNVHPAFTGRVKKLYPLGRSKANDPDGHGTTSPAPFSVTEPRPMRESGMFAAARPRQNSLCSRCSTAAAGWTESRMICTIFSDRRIRRTVRAFTRIHGASRAPRSSACTTAARRSSTISSGIIAISSSASRRGTTVRIPTRMAWSTARR